MNHSEPQADGTRQLQVKLQRRCLIAILKMALHQLPEDLDNSLQEKAASEGLHFGHSQNGSSPQTVQELANRICITFFLPLLFLHMLPL